jgi:hypothetical protein
MRLVDVVVLLRLLAPAQGSMNQGLWCIGWAGGDEGQIEGHGITRGWWGGLGLVKAHFGLDDCQARSFCHMLLYSFTDLFDLTWCWHRWMLVPLTVVSALVLVELIIQKVLPTLSHDVLMSVQVPCQVLLVHEEQEEVYSEYYVLGEL